MTCLTTDDLRTFLIWLRSDYKLYRITDTDRALSNKTIRNIYMFLSSFFTWAGRELNLSNPLKGVPAPKFEQVSVEPLITARASSAAHISSCSISAGSIIIYR